MEKEIISSSQLFVLIFLFEMGTALVLPIGFASQKDVWLSVLLASFGGVLLFLLYNYLFLEYPHLSFSGYTRRILGKNVGFIVNFSYLIFFIYNGSRNLREAGELLAGGVYNQTPILVLETTLLVVIIYALYKGLEVLARTAQISFIVLMVFGLIGTFVVLFSGIVKIDLLRPILENGWKPVITSAYPNILVFPFGEIICFATFLPNLKQANNARNIGIAALVFSALILSFIHALEISVLGEESYSHSPFPLLKTIQKAQIGELIERMDIFAIVALILGDFYKITIYCLSAIYMVSDIFKIENKGKLVFPISFLILISSIMEARNLSEHFKEGELVVRILLPLLAVVIPVILAIIHVFRKRFNLY